MPGTRSFWLACGSDDCLFWTRDYARAARFAGQDAAERFATANLAGDTIEIDWLEA